MSDAIREVQEATIKPYVSMSMSGQYNVLDKDGKVAYSTRDKTLAYDYFKKNFDKLKEDGDHEVSMAIGQLKTISQYAEKMQTILQSKGNDYDIEAWVQSKITSAEDYMNSVAHYMENDPSVNEEVNEVSDIKKLAVLKRKIKQYKDKVFKKTMSTIKSPLFAGYEEVEEGRMKDIFTADQEGKSAEEIAKIMKLPLKTVKNILGEEVFEEISEFTSDMITRLQKSYATMPQRISPEQAKALSKHLDRLDLASLKQLTKAKIPFVTTLARNKVYKKTGKFEAVEEPKQDMPDDKEKVAKENSDKEIASLKDQINILKTKLENEKNKAVKPEPNPKTGEVPLTVGVAYKHFKDAEEKEKKEEVSEKTMSDRDKRIQRAKDMIKYYDAQKKAALKGKNKDLAKKMLKNDIEESTKPTEFKVKMKTSSGMKTINVTVPVKNFKVDMAAIEDAARKKVKGDMIDFDFKGDMKETVSIKAYKNAVDPSKKGLMISKSGGMSGTIMIKDKKELKDLETKLAQAKRLYNIKEMAKDDAYAIGMAQAKKSMNDEPPLDKKTITKGHEIAKKILNKEEKRVYVESMAGLRKKADKSGMPYSILKKVFDRGMAAWKTGHRPGASQQQWAYARVNSFITKSSGTWGGADKDLAKQVKG
jgi:plasmid maintenance system antidote protein VapI